MVNTNKSKKHGIFWLNFLFGTRRLYTSSRHKHKGIYAHLYIVSKYTDCSGALLMVLNATFNNISVIL